MNNIVLVVGVVDAFAVVLCGLVAAFVVMTGRDAKVFWDRVLPATAILVATSIAAGIVLAAARWMGGG